MTHQTRSSGPLVGHWMETIDLIASVQNGHEFVCQVCIRKSEKSVKSSTFRSSSNASNMYAHFRSIHTDLYHVLEPIIRRREKNKREKPDGLITIESVMGKARQRLFNDALLRLFSCPDIPKAVIENIRFIKLVKSINSSLTVATVKTLNSRLWDRYRDVIAKIQSVVKDSEFVVLTFDGWSTLRNQAVFGFMVSTVDTKLCLSTKCVGNLRIHGSHSADDVTKIITLVVRGRLGNVIPNYFVADSAPVNKAAVRKFMENEGGDDFWFPCSVHFCQLAMRESVAKFLTGESSNEVDHQDQIDWDELNSENIVEEVQKLVSSNSIQRLIATCRAITASIRRSSTRAELFYKYQTSLDTHATILRDVPTRFDSTVDMFESIVRNKLVLYRMQESGSRDRDLWPAALILTSDDFDILDSIVHVLQPVKFATKELSCALATVGEVVPTLLYVIEKVRGTSVPARAVPLRDGLKSSLVSRLSMLLGTTEKLPIIGGRKFSAVTLNEYVVSALLIPRYYSALQASFGYSERLLSVEMERLFNLQKCEVGFETDAGAEVDIEPIPSEESLSLQSWLDNLSSVRGNRRQPLGSRRNSFRNELSTYISDVTCKKFTKAESLEFWVETGKSQRLTKLSKLARLLLTVPASSIPQERHFSELNDVVMDCAFVQKLKR